MIAYILKSSLCLMLLWGFYKLFLEKENIHFLKRFYLLFSLVFAFSVPLITLTYEVEVAPQPEIVVDGTAPLMMNVSELSDVKEPLDYTSIIIWSIYGIGVLIFGIRFSKNLIDIGKKVRGNERLKETSHVNVLVGNSIVPHTFLDFIFVSKKEFQQNAIPEQILLHEKTHVLQKHTLDILFVELLQVIFWFNPVFIFIKKSIRLNHEFLADQNVLKQQFSIQSYFDLLVNYKNSSNQAELSSPINYSLTKKRLQMMTKNFSRKRAILKMLAVLPLLAIGLLSFNNDIVAKEIIKEVPELLVTDDFELTIDANNNLYHGEKKISIDEVRNLAKEYVKNNASEKDANANITFHEEANKDLFILPLLDALKDLGMGDVKFKNEGYVEEPQSFEPSSTKNTSEKRTMTISKNWKEKDVQDGVTEEMVKEYNIWAKDLNSKIKGNKPVSVKHSEIYRMINIYTKMNPDQRKRSEQFPDIPPPPPAPEAPKVKKGEKSDIPPPPPPPAPEAPSKVNGNYVEVMFAEDSDLTQEEKEAYVKRVEAQIAKQKAEQERALEEIKAEEMEVLAESQRLIAEAERVEQENRRDAIAGIEEAEVKRAIAMEQMQKLIGAAERARAEAAEQAEKQRAEVLEQRQRLRELSAKDMRKAKIEARKAEKAMRKEETKARNLALEAERKAQKEQVKAEFEAYKAELDAKKAIREAEMQARKAEQQARQEMRKAEMNARAQMLASESAMRAAEMNARKAEQRAKRQTPAKLIENMAKNDAEFYYNGKKISAKKALKLVEDSGNPLSIDASTNNGKSKVIIKD
ncbi:M56 family metallopeptidase [Aquimarina sp. 433]